MYTAAWRKGKCANFLTSIFTKALVLAGAQIHRELREKKEGYYEMNCKPAERMESGSAGEKKWSKVMKLRDPVAITIQRDA